MKRLFSVIAVIFVWQFNLSYAQQPYVKMLYEDAHWITDLFYDINLVGYDWRGGQETILRGDTVVNGKTYKKVYQRSLWKYFDLVQERYRYLPLSTNVPLFDLSALIREDSSTRKVYLIPLSNNLTGCGNGQEVLWYDFSVTVGDTFSNCSYPNSNDTIFSVKPDTSFRFKDQRSFLGLSNRHIKSIPRRKYEVTFDPSYYIFHYHEGIGASTGLISGQSPYLTGASLFLERLWAYWRDSIDNFGDIIVPIPATQPQPKTYTPLLHEDAHWVIRSRTNNYYETTLNGDTVIGGQVYKKMYNQEVTATLPFTPSGPKILCAFLREDSTSRKVFCRIPTLSSSLPFKIPPCPRNQEFLLYDFSTNPHDELVHCANRRVVQYDKVYRPSGLVVEKMDSIPGMDSLNYFYFTNLSRLWWEGDWDNRTHVEGIGSTAGLIESYSYMGGDLARSLESRLAYYCRESLGGCDQFIAPPYRKVLNNDAHWISDTYGPDSAGNPAWRVATETILDGDTLINGQIYKKAYARHMWKFFDQVQQRERYLPGNPNLGDSGVFKLAAFLREDSTARKVYVQYPAGSMLPDPNCPAGQEVLRYDFALMSGDTVQGCGFGNGSGIDTIASIKPDTTFQHLDISGAIVKSVPMRRFDVSSFPEMHYHEAIGSHAGLINNMIDDTTFNRLMVYWRDSVEDYSDVIVKRLASSGTNPTYTPVLNEDAHWITQWEIETQDTYETTVSSDTTVGGMTYKKLYNRTMTSIPPFQPTGPKVLCALIREDVASRQVFWIPLIQSNTRPFKVPSSCALGQESLLYDFSTQVLDELVDCDPTTVTQYANLRRASGNAVSSMNSITGIDSLNFFYFANQDVGSNTTTGSDERTHVEGIGSTEGLVEASNYGVSTASIFGPETRLAYYCRESLGGCEQFLDISISNESSYSSLGWNVWFESTGEVLNIRFWNETPESVVLYDLSGKEIMRAPVQQQPDMQLNVANLAKGVYVLSVVRGTQVVGRKKVAIQ
ncbi:MAG: T9SS type A sorting domain-containing protein [Bacteroidota bacterium]